MGGELCPAPSHPTALSFVPPQIPHSHGLSLHGDPAVQHKTQLTAAGSHAHVRPAPQTQSLGWGPPSQCGCGWGPPRLRGGPSAAGVGSEGWGGFYPAALQTKSPPRAAPPGRAARRSARDPNQGPPQGSRRSRRSAAHAHGVPGTPIDQPRMRTSHAKRKGAAQAHSLTPAPYTHAHS